MTFGQVNLKDVIRLQNLQNFNENQLKELLDKNPEFLESVKTNNNVEKQNIDLEQKKILESLEFDKGVNSINVNDGNVQIEASASDLNDIENNSKIENTNENITIEKEPINSNEVKIKEAGIPYFGYDIFKNAPEVFENSLNESLDPGYLIGPGDEIIIMLWGQTEFNESWSRKMDISL